MDFQLNIGAISVAIIAGALCLLIKAIFKHIYETIKINTALGRFPSMPWHWLYGSLEEAKDGKGTRNDFMQRRLHWVRTYPRAYREWRGPFLSVLHVVHPDTVRPVLKLSDPKGLQYGPLKKWLGDGLLISEGSKWARNRRLLTPAFHFDILKSYVDVFNSSTDVFMNKMQGYIESGQSFPLFRNVSLLTLDIILKCAFSFETDCQMVRREHPYISTVYRLSELGCQRKGKILGYLSQTIYFKTAHGREFLRNCDILHKEADLVISNRRKALAEKGIDSLSNRKYLDFLDIILTAKDADGKGMSDEEIRDEVDTFMFEGHDTTSSGIGWTLYLMAKHPEYQVEVQKEIDELVKEIGSDRFEWDHLSRMPFLTRCLKESMRLYPPVPFIARTMTREIEIDGRKIPVGTIVEIQIWALHHNPTVWGEDHMEYKPSRFEEENIKKMDPFAYIPFSAGPRNCIGQAFAMAEERTVLARLLHRYTFSIAEDCPPVKLCHRIILNSEEEVRLQAARRI